MTEWDPYARRLQRLDELALRFPFAQDVLRYVRGVTHVQQQVHAQLLTTPPPSPRELEPSLLLPFVAPLLSQIMASAPAGLSQSAAVLRDLPSPEWGRLLRARWRHGAVAGESLADLLPEALLMPYAVVAAARFGDQVPDPAAGRERPACPVCDRPPLLSLLRREGALQVRSLFCGRCATEWRYPSVQCPACGEEEPQRLPRFATDELPWVRVEACDTCHRYLKSIDLHREPGAEPLADEIAATPLDVHATEQGYAKLVKNLIGA